MVADNNTTNPGFDSMEDEEDEVFWLVPEEWDQARQWFRRLKQLKRIPIEQLTFIRVDDIWDGPINGIVKYEGKEYYFQAIFDEEAPSLSLSIGRCYLIINLPDELRKEPKKDFYEDPEPPDFTHPVGYFGGSLGYFITHPDKPLSG